MLKKSFNIMVMLLPLWVLGQAATQKEISQHMQTWVSLNTLTKYNAHWGINADFHERWNNFFETNNFYLARVGITYLPNPKVSMTGGYAHMWLAPSNPDWSTYSDEDRIYEQFQLNTASGKVAVIQRFRNEQRWQDKIVDDQKTGARRFTNRIRYLVSFTIPVFDKKTMPSLVVADEIMVQFGKEAVYNTFDQNRIFIGIKQVISPKLSFDFGYMNVYQQKYSGYQYDMNHTLRLFFYLTTGIHHQKPSERPQSGDE